MVVIGGGILAVVGSFLPWITATSPLVGTVARTGLDGGGDGVISLVAGVALVVIGLIYLSTGWPSYEALIGAGVLVVVFAVHEYNGVTDRIAGLPTAAAALVQVGAGIYAIGAGGAAAAVGGFIASRVDPAG
jgi:hypothetical protein